MVFQKATVVLMLELGRRYLQHPGLLYADVALVPTFAMEITTVSSAGSEQ
jgi:hypothetical protein